MTWKPYEPHSIERIQLVYKLVERCNLNCSYCYYYNMGDETALHRPALASLECTTQLAQWLAAGCKALCIPKVLISFHGGEPMLMHATEFAKACDIFVRTISPVAEVSFAIQTNGTLLTDGWLEALKGYRVAVGVSIDGNRLAHDRFRLDHKGRSSFLKTEQAIKRLVDLSSTTPQLQPSTISVLNHEVDYKEIYSYLRELGVKSLHFLLPDRNADKASEQVDQEAAALGLGMLDIFEAWLTEDDPDINIRFINETLGHFQLDEVSQCFPQRRKSNQILVARTDGTIAIDDSLIPALDWYETVSEFPVSDYSLQDVLKDPIFTLLEDEKNHLPDDCNACRWAQMCRGGDLENRYSKLRGFNNKSVYCNTYKALYSGICDFLVANGYPSAEIEKRFGVQ
ncbi:radical SAM protein [Neptunomonas phycophila]|mgnify:CR=1 FL=1|uniref:Radical SAM protein n=1 Tax=Neptunomonas phycophila TaxID=1572645 RepID=A0AAW7XIA3_9GAMM|nr:radical SAM protein [Neptunomonas phycophila]MDO6452797.1 radical SAM protein [Neptunomonas phycophila]